MVLAAFYQSGPADATDFSFAHVVPYVWLGQALLGLFPFRLDHELADSVRTGTVAGELLRPIDLYSYWFWRMVAWRLAMTAPRCLLMLVVAVGILPLVGLGEWALDRPGRGGGCRPLPAGHRAGAAAGRRGHRGDGEHDVLDRLLRGRALRAALHRLVRRRHGGAAAAAAGRPRGRARLPAVRRPDGRAVPHLRGRPRRSRGAAASGPATGLAGGCWCCWAGCCWRAACAGW